MEKEVAENKKVLFCEIGFFLLIFILGCFSVFVSSIAGDETGTVWVTYSLSFSEIFHEKYVGDFNPFGYFYLQKVLVSLFGFNEYTFRMIPVFSWFASFFVFRSCLKLLSLDEKHVLMSLVFMALNPLLLYYSVFARAYSLLLLICLLQSFFLLKFFFSRKKHFLFLYFLVLSAGVYIHFFSGLFAVLLFVTSMLFFLRKHSINFFAQWGGASFLALLVFLPEFSSFQAKAFQVGQIVQAHAKQGYIAKLLFVLYGIVMGETARPDMIVLILLLLLLFSVLLLLKKIIVATKDNFFRFSAIFIFLSALLIAKTGFARPMYVIYTVPFFSLLLTIFCFRTDKRISVFLLLPMLYSDGNFLLQRSETFISPQYTIPYKSIIPEFLSDENPSDTGVIVSPIYNRSQFFLYSPKLEQKNMILLNPFVENSLSETIVESVIKNSWKNILIFDEYMGKNTFSEIVQTLEAHQYSCRILQKLTGKSFLKREVYDYLTVGKCVKK